MYNQQLKKNLKIQVKKSNDFHDRETRWQLRQKNIQKQNDDNKQ